MVGTRLLLAADFDGTLAPIQKDPSTVMADPELAHFLCEAGELEGVAIAIISGRDIDDLAHRVGAIPAYLAGSHGLDIRDPAGRSLRESPPLQASLDEGLEEEILSAGMRLERKKHGIALHWRGAPDASGSHPLRDRFRSWAESQGLELIAGRLVVEARSPGMGKAAALEAIAVAVQAERVVFAGDDLTDFPALEYAAARGHAIFVRSDEREAPPGAQVVATRIALLEAFAEELRQHVPAAVGAESD